MEVDTGVTRPRSGISANSEWPIIWHSIPIVVESRGDVVGDAGIRADNASGPEAPWQVIDTDKVESMTAIVVGSPVFRAQIIVIGGEKKKTPPLSPLSEKNVTPPQNAPFFLPPFP